ncbi:flagellar hook-basal body complex protein FliE [Paucimonas lemoignei]|uniref:Flagellar hook-basal body complex protein FliE n=1 Tax=Paucimonas lemoignei TaxID=29443 RepID=A0A4R3I0H2_PAULE|nr:flagellar hook-basal body complex protein FliE [Paucimonas lemoignei]TCS39187.1 flagellar hook-basal body complex protein FliE [Paucimonas lemoignei]
MKTQLIDTSRIEAMMAQLKSAATRPQGGVNPVATDAGTTSTKKVGFGEALKASLDQVNQTQQKSEQLGQAFMMGDDKVSLSDVMISMQKANINFQATVQVRNKLVSAYHDIMNMQV